MTNAQNINPQRARLWLPLMTQYRQDVGASILPDGDMEGATVTPPWSLVNVTGSKVAGARPGGTGTQFLRITNTAVTASYAQQAVLLPVNQGWHITGWFRGDPTGSTAQAYSGGTVGFFGTNATNVWARFERAGVFDNSQLRLYVSGGVGKYADFDDVSVIEYPWTSVNRGGAVGAPTYVRMGDGHTASTIPAQIARMRGVRFDGTDYMRAPIDFNRTQPFTLAILTTATMPAESFFFATHDAVTNIGVRFGALSSRRLYGYISDNGARNISVTCPNNSVPYWDGPKLFCMTYNGGSVPASISMSIDNVVVSGTAGGTSLQSSISSGRDMLIGARWNGSTPTAIMAASSIYWAGEFPTVLSMYERRLLKARLLREIRVGV